MRPLHEQGIFVSLRLRGQSWCFPVEILTECAAYILCGPELLPEFEPESACQATLHFPSGARRIPLAVKARVVSADGRGFFLGW